MTTSRKLLLVIINQVSLTSKTTIQSPRSSKHRSREVHFGTARLSTSRAPEAIYHSLLDLSAMTHNPRSIPRDTHFSHLSLLLPPFPLPLLPTPLSAFPRLHHLNPLPQHLPSPLRRPTHLLQHPIQMRTQQQICGDDDDEAEDVAEGVGVFEVGADVGGVGVVEWGEGGDAVGRKALEEMARGPGRDGREGRDVGLW